MTSTIHHQTDGEEVPTASAAAFGSEEEHSSSLDHSNDRSPQSDDNNYAQQINFQSKSLLDDDDDDDDEEDEDETNKKTNDDGIPATATNDALVTSSYNTNLSSALLGAIASSTKDSNSSDKESHSFSQVSTTLLMNMHEPARHNSKDNDDSLTLPTVHTWDGFVRQGTRLKTFLDDAMHKVRDSLTGEKHPLLMASSFEDELDKSNEQQQGHDDDDEHEPARQRRRTESVDHHHSAELAREKMTEVMQLQRQLKDAQVQASTLKAANATLREETSSTQQRLDRTVEALRIAGSNAQKARAEADAAEATAASLAQTLQSLQTVVSETKRASQVLHQEHQQVAAAAASIEAKLLQKEGDLARANKELKRLRESNDEFDHSNKRFQEERECLEKTVERQKQELQDLKRLRDEREAMERARKERAEKVEQELREVQALLQEATSGQAQAEQTKTVLKETVNKLCKTNEEMHERFAQQQAASRKENERLSEALAKAEKEAQQLRIDAEASQEIVQRLRLDKQAVEKQVAELKARAIGAERRIKELTNSGMVSPDPATTGGETTPPVVVPTPASTSRPYSLPPLGGSKKSSATSGSSTNKENSGNNSASDKVPSGKVCSICFKASFGLMKSCQCGDPNCKKRAHMSCVNRIQPGPSVSHPGTPAPRLPVVLCQTTAAAAAAAATSNN